LLKGLKDKMTIEYITTRNNKEYQKMVNYTDSKIDKIECINAVDGDPDIYIGSTTKYYLSERMVCYRRDYVQWKSGNSKVGRLTSFELFDKFGVENCRIVLLETFPCTSRDELNAKEATYIRSLKCVNKVILGRTKAMYREEHRDYLIQKENEYYEKNEIDINNRRSQLVICECGCSISKYNFAKHKKSQKHINLVSTPNDVLPSDSSDTIY
jgi:hypothetical protein